MDDHPAYKVLLNAEGQFSLWPSFMDAPAGWQAVGPVGSKRDCLEYVAAAWTDMRPHGLCVQAGGDG